MYNGIMGGVHLVQAILMIVVSSDVKFPVTTSYLTFDTMTFTLQPFLEEVAQFRIVSLIALFLLLSASAHILLVLPGIYEWYTRNLKKGVNLCPMV